MRLTIDNNTNITSAFEGILIDGTNDAGMSTIFIESFMDNTIHADNGDAGIVIDTATFDADLDDGEGDFDVVDWGDTVIGDSGLPDGVGGAGIVMAAVSGDISFTSLDIVADGGAGLWVAGTSQFFLPSTGFRLATPAGSTIVATNGPVLDLDALTMNNILFGNITSTDSTGVGINIDTVDGFLTVIGTTTITNPTGTGILAANSGAASLDFGSTTITDNAIGMGATAKGIDIATNNAGAAFSFDSLSITTDGGAGLIANNSGTFNINSTMATINATGGAAVDITNTAGQTNAMPGWTFASLTSTNSTAMGVNLNTLANNFSVTSLTIDGSSSAGLNLDTNTGTFTATGGSIGMTTTTLGNAVDINGGSADITIGTTVTNGSGRLVDITGRSGGTVTLSGAMTGTADTGFNLGTNSGGAVNFSGTVDLTNSTTAGISLASNTGGTFTFADVDINNATSNQTGLLSTGTNTGATLNTTTGTVDSGTGTAVNLDNLALGINLVSVDSDGGGNMGIDLRTTTGSFTVTGDGTGAQNGTGGSIQNKTVSGIFLSDVAGISLTGMFLQDNTGTGIDANGVNGFVLDDSIVTRNEHVGGGFSGIQAGLHLRNMSGTCGMDNTEVSESEEVNIYIVNETTSLTGFVINNCLVEITDPMIGAHGILMEGRTTGSVVADVQNSTIRNNRSSGVAVNTSDTSNMDIDITSNAFDTNNNAVDLGHNSSGNFFFTVTGTMVNPQTMLNGQGASVINVNLGLLGNLMRGTVDRNTVGTHMVAGSGTTGGSGIRAVSNGAGTLNVNITNNNVRGIDAGDGINILARDGSNTLRVVVENNDVRTLSAFASGIYVDNGALGTDTTTICASIQNNTAVGGGFFGDIEMDNNQALVTFNLERFVGVGNAANVVAHLEAENTIGFAFATITPQVMGVADDGCNF